jgi:hypothetical protein
MNNDGGKGGKIHHGGNPILTRLGAAVVPDVAGNLAVRGAASAVIRIDAIVAT